MERYPGIQMPVLLLGGERSPALMTQILQALAAVLPQAEPVILLADQGHLGPQFASTRVAQLIEEFAERQTAGGGGNWR